MKADPPTGPLRWLAERLPSYRHWFVVVAQSVEDRERKRRRREEHERLLREAEARIRALALRIEAQVKGRGADEAD